MSTYEAIRYNFTGASITALNGSNISTGTVAEARVDNLSTSKITSGTFADARLSSSSITQHVDLTSLSASNLTSGTIPNARYGSPTFNGSNLTSLPSSAPSTSQVLSATAGASSNSVGSYALVYYWNSYSSHTHGTNVSGSNMLFSSCAGTVSGTPSGTWKIMGQQQGGSGQPATTTVGLRVS